MKTVVYWFIVISDLNCILLNNYSLVLGWAYRIACCL